MMASATTPWKAALLAMIGVVPPVAAQSFGPQGSEFHINTYTTEAQTESAVAMMPDRSFVVVWESFGQDGSSYGVFGQRFDADGAPAGPEFRVNAFTTGEQRYPGVAADSAGNFVVVWEENRADGSSTNVFAQRFDAGGSPLGGEFRVNAFTTGGQGKPAVAMDPAGGFVVVWDSSQQDGALSGVFGQRFDGAGAPQGAEFRANTYTTSGQFESSVASVGGGGFVVVWQSFGQDGSDRGVFGQRFDSAGPVGGEFRVNTYTTDTQFQPAVAADPSGRFTVVWESDSQDGSSYGVFAQRYDATGAPQGPEFQVNTLTTSTQSRPAIVADGSGQLLFAWQSLLHDGNNYAIVGQRYDAAGVRLGGEFVVNSYTTQYQGLPALAGDGDGDYVAVWESFFQEGSFASRSGLYGQRFGPTDLIFADGFESGDLSAWSAASTGGGDLSVSGAAALKGSTNGLQGVVDDTTGLYVQDDLPEDEYRYRARFYFDTNGFDPGETSGRRRTRIFIAFEESPTRRLMAVVLRRLAGQYALMGRARLDDNSQDDTGFFDISPGAHFVEVAWSRATGPDANDGSFQLWIDGTSVSTRTGLDNSLSAVDFVRLGALSVKLTADGTLYWDEFESRRLSYIGP